MRWKWIATGLAFALITVSIFAYDLASWHGHYLLTISQQLNEAVDGDSLKFFVGWDDQHALGVMEHGAENDELPRIPRREPPQYLVSVLGAQSLFLRTYNQPEYLVVQYRQKDSDPMSPAARKKFDLPQTRGDREITIQLP